MTNETIVVGDIGGTNARFAALNEDPDKPGYHDELTLQCANYSDIEQAIRFYLHEFGLSDPTKICLAIAGPIEGQQAKLTNNDWFIDGGEISRRFSDCEVRLINDFTAIALSVPAIGLDELEAIGPHAPKDLTQQNFSVGVIGPGTGLGIAGLIRSWGHIVPITSEAGHMGFSPETNQQAEVLRVLRERWPRVSSERLVSGSGLENIHWALNRIEDKAHNEHSAAQIFEQAQNDHDSIAYTAVQMFFEVLGQVAGDTVLAYSAYDGIYIAGGMVKRYPELLRNSRFREAFANKGRHSAIVEAVPTSLINHPQPGLLGCCVAVRDS